MEIKALDAHCHADLLVHYDPQFPGRYGALKCAGISWSYLEQIYSWESYPAYWNGLAELCRKFCDRGIPFFFLAGIHPRSIPLDLPESSPLHARLSDALAFHMQSPLCLGMGELGLDTGSPREERILRLQLDWALANLPEEKRIGIHTPRREKERVTLQTLALLEDYPSLQSRVLVDHVTPATWTFLQKTPYMMGITLQDGKTALPSFLQFMAGHGHNVDRIMLNSDGAKSLSLPFLQFLGDTECLDTESRQALLRGNAARFFALDL